MKIALVSQEYPPETAKGGIATQTYLRAHGLTSLGHQVWVISQSTDGEARSYKDGEVNVYRIPLIDHLLPVYNEAARWLTYSVDVAVTLHRINREVGFDLAVFPEWGGEGYIHLLNQTQWNHIPSIVHIHGPMVMFGDTMNWPDKDSDFYRVGCQMEGTSLRLADAVTASNGCSRKWCAEHYGLDEEAIPVLYSGIDTRLFAPLPVEKYERPTIIFVGSVRRNKGVDLLLKAGALLLKDFPDLQLKILGKGESGYMKSLERLVKDEGLGAAVEFKGQVNRADLPEELSKAHLFAAPSVYEGGPGNVYLEAMACGLPAIACSGSGVEGAVLHGNTGYMVEPGHLDQLVNAMGSLLKDRSMREEMGRNGRNHVLDTADTSVCMRRLEEHYCAVSARARATRVAS